METFLEIKSILISNDINISDRIIQVVVKVSWFNIIYSNEKLSLSQHKVYCFYRIVKKN